MTSSRKTPRFMRLVNLTGRTLTIVKADGRKTATLKPDKRRRIPQLVEPLIATGPHGLPLKQHLLGCATILHLPKESRAMAKVKRIYIVTPEVGFWIRGRDDVIYPDNPAWASGVYAWMLCQ